MTKRTLQSTTTIEHLTVEDVASRLKCSVSTVWRMVRRGEFITQPYFGRTVVDSGQVERWLQKRADEQGS